MNDAQSLSDQPVLSISQEEEVDRLADAFEQRWRSGGRARIEDYLDQINPSLRTALLRELVALEIEFRRAAGEPAPPDEFQQRFPDDAGTIEAFFAAVGRPTPPSTLSVVSDDSTGEAGAGDSQPRDRPKMLGRYEIRRVLGDGGFGTVYLAHDPQLDRPVALKIPRPTWFASADRIQAFVHEARIAAQLKHPGLVTVYDVQPHGDGVYIVEEYIDGQDLAGHFAASSLSFDKIAQLIIEIAEAIGFAHQRNLVHRDLKPGNILIDRQGRPHVADFGLALDEDLQRQRRGEIAGTPAYMSPEQVRGETHRLDGRTDLWSLGVVLYEVLTARRPFSGKDRDEMFDEIEHRDPKPPRMLNRDVPGELERICLKCLSKQRTQRYNSAAELVDDLRHWLDDGRGKGAYLPLPPGEGRGEGGLPRASVVHAAPPKIVPKGLRSFDAGDADFFLALLPGPHDRDGFPPGIRFWKTQIEETDRDRAFSVGVIYGPSGCGKSSLVKAGLLPRLAEKVLPIYVEATAADTEVRLLKGLRKACPKLSADASLPELIAELRGRGGPGGRKVLVVLDQFEQWLHARDASSNSQLVPALRQCDGAAVQCLVLVRDDFWMSVTRFMQALEIPLVEGHNSAAVDLFDLDHARKVLAAFGRAYGKLPELPEEPTQIQSEFLDEAVHGVAQEGKVISVRLALFAEMMKGLSWTPASLEEVGGTEGVGVAFLESTFSAKTAPPSHRLHQEAARKVLKALLPDLGTDIKGQMKSHGAMLAASGYAGGPADFASLLAILDGELRLITPTEPDEVEGRHEPEAPARREGDALLDGLGRPSSQDPRPKTQDLRWYQLTHDYLVPSLRDWLTRKQRETRRGRAELRLAERAAAYAAKPDARHLPGWWEWPNILLFTRRRNWTAAERRVMRAATRFHGLRFSFLASMLAIGALAARRAYLGAEDRRAAALARSLFAARADGVPYELDALRPMRTLALAHLQKEANDQRSDPVRQLHAAYGLADLGDNPQRFLLDNVPTAPAAECRNIVTALEHVKGSALPDLAKLVDSATDPKTKARYAIVALHLGDPAPATRWLALREDPIDRTTLIHSYPAWHGKLGPVAEALGASSDGPFRSGLCAALGLLAAEDLPAEERDALTKLFTELYLNSPDGGTHGAAGWALRAFKQPLPAVEQTAEPPAGRDWHVNRQGMTLITIPAGSFVMGYANADAATNDAAAHTVTLSRSFLLCDREVTIEQFQRFVDDSDYAASEKPDNWQGAWQFGGQTPDCPIQQVSWYDAILYCNWLSKKEGKQPCYTRSGTKEMVPEFRNGKQENVEHDKWDYDFAKGGYRLPTEAEWEYACRAVSAKAFCFGDDEELLAAYAWFASNSRSRAWPGGLKLPNAWGLFDMHGNVFEWCYDLYGSTTGANRVVRGGGWSIVAAYCRTAHRVLYLPSNRFYYLGFRLALSSVQPSGGDEEQPGAKPVGQ